MSIRIENIGKQFARRAEAAPRSFKEWFVQWGRRAPAPAPFWALRDVSVTVADGEMLGVIGANGAGKSTLLRLIGGVLAPDAGTVAVDGRIGGLLSLYTGFADDLTGRENIYTAGIVAGLSRREVTRRMDAIIDFAELAPAIDAPFRTYSTGMQLRLGFAIAMHTDPDVLLIDEALSVGDLAFQQKCLARIKAFQRAGCALVFVSHAPAQVRQLCDRVLWLEAGRVVACGPPDVVTGQYESQMMAETLRRLPDDHPAASGDGAPLEAGTDDGSGLILNETRFGSLEATISAVRLLGADGRPAATVAAGRPLTVEVTYDAPTPVASPIVSVALQRPDGTVAMDVNTEAEQVPLPSLAGRGRVQLQLDRLGAAPGDYFVNVGLYAAGWCYAYDFHWQAYTLRVTGGQPAAAPWSPPRRWVLEEGTGAQAGAVEKKTTPSPNGAAPTG
jgi:lipopolysaccharide transport system ATP-binding protein